MSYSKPDGKTISQMYEELLKVYSEYSEYSGMDGTGFKEMVKMFARDDFYNLHFIAKEFLPYLDISDKF